MRHVLDYISLRLLRRINIRFRLINSFILLAVLPLMISGMLSYQESSVAIQEKTRIYFTEIVRQVSINVQLQMDQIESASEELVLSDRVQSALQRYYGSNEIETIRARSELTHVLLEKYGASSYINQKYFLDNALRVMDTQVFPQLGESVTRLVRTPVGAEHASWHAYRVSASQTSIVMLRKIRSKENNQPAGTLFIGIKPSHFSGIFDMVDLGPDASTFILDAANAGVLVKGRGKAQQLGDVRTDQALAKKIMQSTAEGLETSFITFEDAQKRHYVAAYSHIPETSWFVVNMVPLASLNAGAQSLRDKILMISGACFLFGLLCSFIIARSISFPLDHLVGIMQQTEAGNYHLRVRSEGADEITTLASRFNEMASKVDEHRDRLEERVAERTRELETATQTLEILSTTDGLTGIANRRRFDQSLAAELMRATRTQTPLTLMLLDVDLFKGYNDFYGHQAGDDCLRTVAQLLQSRCRRSSDLAARYGGEEFTFVAIDTDAESALALAESIRTDLQALALPHERSPFNCVTVSIGVVTRVPELGITSEAFLRMADAAMYRAKNAGRNRSCVAGEVV